MEEENNSNISNSTTGSFGELCPDNEGLEDRLLASPFPRGTHKSHTDEFSDEEKDYHETEQINGNFQMKKEPSNRNVVSNNDDNPANDIPISHVEVEESKISHLSIVSTSGDQQDDHNLGSFTPLSTPKSFGSVSGHHSPRHKRYGLGILSGKKQSSLSSLEEESAALNELHLILSEKNSDKLLIERDAAGFISSLHIVSADLDGPIPECICMFTQLSVLVIHSCNASGPFPFWIDALTGLQKLDLSDNRLTGPISESVSSLRLLQELALHNNQLSGVIPDGIGSLKALSTLQLHHNELTGSLPDTICRLPKLSVCDISNCFLSGHIPYRIGKLKQLTVLNLEANSLAGTIPGSIGDLSALEALNLAHNSLRGRLPESLGRLHLLSILDLSHNELTGSLPASIGDLASLTALSLANNHLRGPVPESLCGLSMLKSLALNKNVFSGGIPAGLGRLRDLKTLRLSYNRLKGSIPEEVCSLSQLAELSVDRNSLTGCLPEGVGLLGSLATLNASHNQLSGEIPEGVGALKALVTLHLSHNRLTGGIPESIGSLACLQILNVSHNQLSGPLPESIVELRALRDLDVSFNRLAGTIPVGIVDLPLLTEVNFIDTFLSGYDLQKGVFLMSSCGIWAADQYGQRGISVVHFEDWSPIFYHEAPLMQKEHHASFYSHVRPAVLAFLKKVCEAQKPCILKCLVVLWYLLTAASKVHISEEADLLEFAEELVGITNELFKCPSMDKLKNVQRLVLEPQYCQPIQKNLDGSFHSVTYWNMAHIFSDNSPIQFCLERKHKFVLALTQITSITDQLFWGCINTVPNGGAEEPKTPWEFSNTEFHSLAAYKIFACPRYTPAVMFFIEGMSKLLTLLIVSFVCFETYGVHNHGEYAGSLAENALVVMMLGQIFYELGQLASCNWSLREYFSGVWNILDVTCCVLLLVWALLLPFPHLFAIGKVAIALAAIPLAFLQLQYLSLIKTLGLLVLMIQAMITDVYTFIVVYLVCIYGFTVCFRAMFYTLNDYSSTGITFVTLFQSTLGNFRFDEFDGTFKLVGVLVMVLFLTLTNVLLVNLLIAQMSSTFNRIIFKSREEWTFIKATYVQDNMLLAESNPFCMLPAPLNLVTITLYPLHVWALEQYHVSVAGTAADYMLGMWLYLPRTLLYWWKRVLAAFLDAEEEDAEFLEAHHLAIRALVYCLGKRPSRVVAYLLSLPFGAVYVAVSSVLRIFHAVVRVRPLGAGEGEGDYEINFYLHSEESDGAEEPVKSSKKAAVAANKTAASSSGSSPGLRAVKSAFRLLSPSRKPVLGSFKDPNSGAYTFADDRAGVCEPAVREGGSEGEDLQEAPPVVSSRASQRVAPAASPAHPPAVTQKSFMLHLQLESNGEEVPGVTADDLVDKGCRSPTSPQPGSDSSGKLKPKTSFLGLDGFLNLGQGIGRRSPSTSEKTQGAAIPGQSNVASATATGSAPQQETTVRTASKGILAAAFPSKKKHKVDIHELGRSQADRACSPTVDTPASLDSSSTIPVGQQQLLEQGDGQQGESDLPAENFPKSRFFLRRSHSKKEPCGDALLEDSVGQQREDRTAHTGTARRRSGGGRPQNQRRHSRRQSKPLSSAPSYHTDEEHEHDQEGDSEGQRGDEDGHDSELDDSDRHDTEWECRSDDESAVPRGLSSASIDAIKTQVLFTPADIERMFPAAQKRRAQQEMDEQLHKLIVSSEQAMAAASDRLVASLDTKLQEAVLEIKTLRADASAVPAAVAEPMSAVPTPTAAAHPPAAEVEQLQAELLGMQKDMRDIKKLLGNILIKLK